MRVRGAHLLCKRSSLTPAFAPLVRSEDVEVFSFGDCRFAFMEASARRGFKLEGFLLTFVFGRLRRGRLGRMVGDLRLPRAQAVRHSSPARGGVVYDGRGPGRSLRSLLGLR
jgi:hypothetical protein